MKHKLLLLTLFLPLALFLLVTACNKKELAVANEAPATELMAGLEENFIDDLDDPFNNLEVTARSDNEPTDSCCKVVLFSYLPDGSVLHYKLKNPNTPTSLRRLKITITDADFGGVLFTYSWGGTFSACANWNKKIHLADMIRTHLNNCFNRYQVLMEFQTKASSTAPWLTCSSSLSPIFILGTNYECE